MIRVNLLPHREEKRKRRQQQFLGLAVFSRRRSALVVAGAVWFFLDQQVQQQQANVAYMKGEIAKLDKQIEEIRKIREETASLLAKKQVVEGLQSNRSEPVQLLDQLLRQLPEGIYLKAVKQTGVKVNVLGYAQSNARVSTLMRNLGASPYLENPELVEIKAVLLDNNPNKRVNEFSMNISVKRAKAEDAGGKGARTPAGAASRRGPRNEPARRTADARPEAAGKLAVADQDRRLRPRLPRHPGRPRSSCSGRARTRPSRPGASRSTSRRQAFLEKKKLAVNLEAYKQQRAEIEQSFGALLKQLPNKSEMDALLIDINQAGLGRGLAFELFKPSQTENFTEFYAELPVNLKVTGNYHDLGAFASDVAKMPRIVLLTDLKVDPPSKEGTLSLEAVAKTYRYLDEEEIAKQRKAAKDKASKAKGAKK